MNKKEKVEKVISIAKGEIGYKEGKGNITKYSKFFDDLRKKGVLVYNYPKQGASWCDIFVDWCFVQAFGVEEGLATIYQPMNSCGAGCKFSAEFYRKNNAFVMRPEVGDQIFFGKKGSETHTGIVSKVTEKMVYTIEGNKGDQVKACSYKLTNENIVGYGRPNWDVNISASSGNKDEKPKEEKPKSDTNSSQGSGKTEKMKVIADRGLNLRKGPSTDFPKLACMPKGSVFLVSKKENGWAYGSYGKISGYASMQWLKKG